MAKTLRLVLGDQLNENHSWFKKRDKDVIYLMMEIRQETDYVSHHIQKVIAIFQAMRQFAQQLDTGGHKFTYLKISDKSNLQTLEKNVRAQISNLGIDRFEYLFPDEYRLDQQLKKLVKKLEIPFKAVDSEHFLSDRDEVENQFDGKKTFLMEAFYRKMRLRYDVLMEGKNPAGGKWNFDADNRNRLDKDQEIPPQYLYQENVSALLKEVKAAGVKTIGNIDAENFHWPRDRKDALKVLDHFCEHLLPLFGKYQDAMHSNEPFLFHSRLSFALNVKMLHPLQVISKVKDCWKKDPEKFQIAAVEGFVRQILGWREYMRGVYWTKMPEYEQMNFFGHQNKLPDFYWDGNTKMNCMGQAINQSLKFAYAHHIQRLMVTGNFALLAGIDPDQVDEWYLGIYIDAFQWVEITNTRGMSQFADGGIVGTKPYVSSANYIDKMSNYCGNCHYKKNKKFGEKACPFNSLYWAFYERNRDKLENNPRIGFVYNTLGKMKDKEKILQQAAHYLNNLNEL